MLSLGRKPNQWVLSVKHPLPDYRRFILSRIRLVTFGVLLLSAVSLSCNETLPTYQEPTVLLDGKVDAYFERVGRDAIPQFTVLLRVRNIFDETLQGNKNLSGSLDIVSTRAPEYRKSANVGQGNAIYPYLLRYQLTPTITIDSGDSLLFMFPWNLWDDNNIFVPNALFVYDSTNHIWLPEDFVISGTFQVFDKVGQVTIQPTHCTLNYR